MAFFYPYLNYKIYFLKIIETHIVPELPDKIRLQEYAANVFSSISTRSGIKKAIKRGLILLDDRPAGTGDWIWEGQRIDLLKPASTSKKTFDLRIPVLYEDEYLAVVHKPAGFPTSGNYFKTIQNALPGNLKASKKQDVLKNPLPVHRLDNPTSGILICAKTRNSLVELQKAFSEKRIKKQYAALVHGEIEEIYEATASIEGKPAKTIIIPDIILKIRDEKYTLAKAIPFTGRTHQIRIHLSGINHPIVGDDIYGIEENGIFKNRLLYLFAQEISFQHPVSFHEIKCKLKLPKRFRNLINLYGLH